MSCARTLLAAVIVVAIDPASVVAQTATFTARLSTVPVDATNRPLITGSGRATATLSGNKLSISGSFTGLQTPATSANVHIGPKAIRGPATFELMVTRATAGTIRGELTLTPAQLDHLKQSRFYVQLQSDKAPDGNLWGWLLP